MIILKTIEELDVMREAGKKLARVLSVLKEEVKAGVKTLDLDARAKELIEGEGARPAFLGYTPGGTDKPYPFTLCASINETVVHGLPSDYVIQEGDLVKLDLGLIHRGFYSDAAVTVKVGEVTEEAKKLVWVTEEALKRGIAAAQIGTTLGDLGAAIGNFIKENKFGIVKTLTGHGIGRNLHEDPYVFNFGRPGEGEELKEGMVLALEPMVTAGGEKVKQMKDDSFVTVDGSLAAHFEHTVAITKNGPEVLTKI
jgi:methionyl aminopeptidase